MLEPLFKRFGPLATQYWGTAAPTLATDIGPFNVGDIVWHTDPAAGDPLAWICTTAGATGATAVFSAVGVAGGAATAADLTKLNSITKTAAQINGLVQGAASGYKLARGEVTLDGGNPTSVLAATTGLATVTAAFAALKAAAAPGDDPSWLSVDYGGSVAAGQLDIYAWKNTGGTDPTLEASTNSTAVVSWIAIGT